MKILKNRGTATILVIVLAACASQMRTGAAMAAERPPTTDVDLSNDLSHRYGESQIAVNPKNPNNLVYVSLTTGFTYACQAAKSPDCEIVPAKLGSMTMSQPSGQFTRPGFDFVTFFVSFDRGKTWRRVKVPVHPSDQLDLNEWGDPSVTAGPDGTFYASWDDLNWGTPEKALPHSGVAMSKSTNGGRTWSVPVLTGTHADGPKSTADLNTGTIYEASSGKVVSSKDGVHWTKPESLGGHGSTSAAHGMFAAAFKTSGQQNSFSASNDELCGGAPTPCIIFETTKDDGATWSRHVMAVPGAHTGQVLVAADPSKREHFAVAVAADSGKQFDVYQTSDSGTTWIGPVIVAEDSTKTHFKAAMAYSPRGVLGIVWRTNQPGPGQTAAPVSGGFGGGPAFPYNVWAAISRDGGATFGEPLEVSRADSPAPQSGAFGNAADDYSSIALDRGYAYVSWADWRSGDRSAFFSAIPFDDFKQKQ